MMQKINSICDAANKSNQAASTALTALDDMRNELRNIKKSIYCCTGKK